jgi:hypothetical protein
MHTRIQKTYYLKYTLKKFHEHTLQQNENRIHGGGRHGVDLQIKIKKILRGIKSK